MRVSEFRYDYRGGSAKRLFIAWSVPYYSSNGFLPSGVVMLSLTLKRYYEPPRLPVQPDSISPIKTYINPLVLQTPPYWISRPARSINVGDYPLTPMRGIRTRFPPTPFLIEIEILPLS